MDTTNMTQPVIKADIYKLKQEIKQKEKTMLNIVKHRYSESDILTISKQINQGYDMLDRLVSEAILNELLHGNLKSIAKTLARMAKGKEIEFLNKILG